MKSTEIVSFSDTKEVVVNDNFVVVYDKESKEVTIRSNVKLNIDFCTDLSLNINGSLDLNASDNINIRANKECFINSKTLWLNSRKEENCYDEEFNKQILGVNKCLE